MFFWVKQQTGIGLLQNNVVVIFIIISVSMIRFLFVLGNFLEDPSVMLASSLKITLNNREI